MNDFNQTFLCFGVCSFVRICMLCSLRVFIFISADIKMRRCVKGETDGYEMKKAQSLQ